MSWSIKVNITLEWILEDLIKNNFRLDTLTHWYWEHFFCLFMKLYWEKCQQSWVNIGSGNGLAPSGNKPLTDSMLTQSYVTIWHHQATMS